MRLSDFSVLTFDCYGTLIDWESGIRAALVPWLERHGAARTPDDILAAFGRHESAQQRETPAMLYPELLANVLRRVGAEWDLDVRDDEAVAFGASVRNWPAFADSPEALVYLKQHYRLVVLSNVDNESFAASNARLGVDFDAVFTAEDIGSYKPDQRNFDYMLEKLSGRGIARAEILHMAQSLFHDHVAAHANGLATAWIDRRAGKGGGATVIPEGEVRTDFVFTSMEEMAEAHRAELGG